ncbi:MAG TPA: hypothetical protein VGO58_06940 [Chitinophagaceae bacterium]|jgi:hypothetical protein|nr:hypothetical protein [Chitinophagaceae bacterium]
MNSLKQNDGLEFVSSIRDSLNLVPVEKIADRVRAYWKNKIRPLFCQEEKIILSILPADHPQALKLQEEQEDILELLLCIDRDPDIIVCSLLCNHLEAHIRSCPAFACVT